MTILKAELWTSLSYLLWETQLETPIICAADSTFVVQTPPKKKQPHHLETIFIGDTTGPQKVYQKKWFHKKRTKKSHRWWWCVLFPKPGRWKPPSGVSPTLFQAVIFFPPHLVGQRWWFYPGSELQSSQLDVAASGRWPLGRGVCCCCGAFRGGG